MRKASPISRRHQTSEEQAQRDNEARRRDVEAWRHNLLSFYKMWRSVRPRPACAARACRGDNRPLPERAAGIRWRRRVSRRCCKKPPRSSTRACRCAKPWSRPKRMSRAVKRRRLHGQGAAPVVPVASVAPQPVKITRAASPSAATRAVVGVGCWQYERFLIRLSGGNMRSNAVSKMWRPHAFRDAPFAAPQHEANANSPHFQLRRLGAERAGWS